MEWLQKWADGKIYGLDEARVKIQLARLFENLQVTNGPSLLLHLSNLILLQVQILPRLLPRQNLTPRSTLKLIYICLILPNTSPDHSPATEFLAEHSAVLYRQLHPMNEPVSLLIPAPNFYRYLFTTSASYINRTARMPTTPNSAMRPWKLSFPLPLYNIARFRNTTKTIMRRTYRPVLSPPPPCRSVFITMAKFMISIIIRRLTPVAIATLVKTDANRTTGEY